ncbi:MAG: PhoH family protein [Planctomycetota bacterium]|nr:PhoH family protein [Planctomycetota bacterium]
MTEITIPLRTQEEAILVLGPYDRYAKLLRQDLDVDVFSRKGNLRIKGPDSGVAEARSRIEHLLGKARKGRELSLDQIESILIGPRSSEAGAAQRSSAPAGRKSETAPRRETSTRPAPGRSVPGHAGRAAVSASHVRIRPVEPRGENQRIYMELLEKRPLVFGVGPAGTGKTYLAVAAAVRALRQGVYRRLVITRPVVEAGERLGFLPGDLQQKLNPYMRPIYDALYDLIGADEATRLEDAGVIEVAPLAYMRGRTLSRAFVILDEGQNTTISQMKMFLTRLGEQSCMVVTGDPSQNDLERGVRSGLPDALQRLRGFGDVGSVQFQPTDIVRHPLVEQIVRAYQAPARTEAEPEATP